MELLEINDRDRIYFPSILTNLQVSELLLTERKHLRGMLNRRQNTDRGTDTQWQETHEESRRCKLVE
jgi:hypothetical protein